jgi:AcrR family transcriptional regulator
MMAQGEHSMTQEDKNEILVLHHAAIQGICLKYAPEAMSYGDVESMAGVPTGMVYHHAANIETSLCEMYESLVPYQLSSDRTP